MPRILHWKIPGRLPKAPSFSTAPQIFSVSPAVARAGVATAVTIRGAGFRRCPSGAQPQVTFGGVAATSVVVVDQNTITCNTPVTTTTGVFDVSVTVGCCP